MTVAGGAPPPAQRSAARACASARPGWRHPPAGPGRRHRTSHAVEKRVPGELPARGPLRSRAPEFARTPGLLALPPPPPYGDHCGDKNVQMVVQHHSQKVVHEIRSLAPAPRWSGFTQLQPNRVLRCAPAGHRDQWRLSVVFWSTTHCRPLRGSAVSGGHTLTVWADASAARAPRLVRGCGICRLPARTSIRARERWVTTGGRRPPRSSRPPRAPCQSARPTTR